MFTSLLCLVLPHRISRRKVWDDGLNYRTGCTRCGASMIRRDKGWRRYSAARDDDPRRLEKPEH